MLFSLLAIVILLFFLVKEPSKCLALVFIWYPTIVLLPVCRGVNVTTLFIYLLLFHSFYTYGKKPFLSFPFLIPFVVCLASYFISAIFGYKIALSVAKWVEQYFLVWTIWVAFKPTKSNNHFLFYNMMGYLLFLDAYAMVESVTIENPFLDYLRSCGVDIPKQAAHYVRYGLYRSQSLTVWTSIMAIASGLGAIFLAFSFFEKKLKPTPILYLTWVFCMIGVFISGTRSAMAVTAIGAFCFLKKLINFKYIVILSLVGFVAVSITGDFFSEVVNSFVNPEEAGGSSVEQRSLQFLVAYRYWMNAPILGNGLDFTNFLVAQEVGLLGAESILFRLLIDRGLVGLFSFLFLYGYSCWILYRKGLSNLAFILIGFAFGKLISLMFTLDEAYPFAYVVFLMKILNREKLKLLKLYLLLLLMKEKKNNVDHGENERRIESNPIL